MERTIPNSPRNFPSYLRDIGPSNQYHKCSMGRTPQTRSRSQLKPVAPDPFRTIRKLSGGVSYINRSLYIIYIKRNSVHTHYISAPYPISHNTIALIQIYRNSHSGRNCMTCSLLFAHFSGNLSSNCLHSSLFLTHHSYLFALHFCTP
jgi:hypothetical protein